MLKGHSELILFNGFFHFDNEQLVGTILSAI